MQLFMTFLNIYFFYEKNIHRKSAFSTESKFTGSLKHYNQLVIVE